MNGSKLKVSKYWIAVLAAASLILLIMFLRGDDQPTSIKVRDAIFQSTYLSDSDDRRDSAFCFGLGGGIDRGSPCIYIVAFRSSGPDSNSEYCYEVSYIAEDKYASDVKYMEVYERYYPFDQNYLAVTVCGKFEPAWGVKRPDGEKIENWTFVNDTFISQYISNDLKRLGYSF